LVQPAPAHFEDVRRLTKDQVDELAWRNAIRKPQPPFDAGSPQKAGPEVAKQVRKWMAPMEGKMIQACMQAAKSLPN